MRGEGTRYTHITLYRGNREGGVVWVNIIISEEEVDTITMFPRDE